MTLILMLSFNSQYKGQWTIIRAYEGSQNIPPTDYNLFSLLRKIISFISSSPSFLLFLLYLYLHPSFLIPFICPSYCHSSLPLLYFKNCLGKYHSNTFIIMEAEKVHLHWGHLTINAIYEVLRKYPHCLGPLQAQNKVTNIHQAGFHI